MCDLDILDELPFCTQCFQVPTDPEVAKHAALFHHVSLVMLPWLLPGSEYLAHELMATMVFNKDFIP